MDIIPKRTTTRSNDDAERKRWQRLALKRIESESRNLLFVETLETLATVETLETKTVPDV